MTPADLARHRLRTLGYQSIADTPAEELWPEDLPLVLQDIEATRETGDWDSEYQRDRDIAEAKRCARILYTGRV